ncbi:MAG: methyltransferase domain-containing protein [Myxococcaceae bacterium]|nr:methyltransferase domain-containing protein [Myxococcaceae bacterium]
MSALASLRERRDPAFDPTLTAFVRFAERRFGLAAGRWNALAARKRLNDLMARGAERGETASDFVARLEQSTEDSPLALAAAEVLPNGETSFFRDLDQLEAVARVDVPAIAERVGRDRPVRILSAGCSTGEEVYSLAMLLFDASFVRWGAPVEIVGVDLRAEAVEQARSGVYPISDLRRVSHAPVGWERRFFRAMPGAELTRARPFLRQLCSFAVGDLLRPATLARLGRFDVVLCRNVLIHFEPGAAQTALQSLRGLLAPMGRLVLSHAEAALNRPFFGEAIG